MFCIFAKENKESDHTLGFLFPLFYLYFLPHFVAHMFQLQETIRVTWKSWPMLDYGKKISSTGMYFICCKRISIVDLLLFPLACDNLVDNIVISLSVP